MMYLVSREKMIEAVAAFEAAGGDRHAAAAAIGVGTDTLQKRLKAAERKGLTGNTLGGPTLQGYHFGKITSLVNKDGEIVQWQHQHPDDEDIETFIQAAKVALADIPAYNPAIKLSFWPGDRVDWEVFFPIVDHHFGMYAWAKETGQNYDLDIAKEVLLSTTSRNVLNAPSAEVAYLLGLGDFFHMDNYENRTEKSRNPLDGDSRYPKVLQQGVTLWRTAIDMALAKYPTVVVRILPGNHDKKGAIILALCLANAYENEPRVLVDTDPSAMWFHQWGRNMFGAHHGDMIKPEQFPHRMAAIKPKMWGDTQFRYAWSGHVHRWQSGPRGLEADGASYQIFEASTARDAWNAEKGFTSNRRMEWRAFNKNGDFQTGGSYIRS